MNVLELCESCSNTGEGKIKVINVNNPTDRAKFNDLNELKRTYVKNLEVSTWKFIPHERIGDIDWEFTLEITV